MRKLSISLLVFMIMGLISCQGRGPSSTDSSSTIGVIMETNKGSIELELDSTKAPLTVKNFLRYADEGFYNNTIFHRVIDNFMIQGGGFTKDMGKKDTHSPIKNEASNGLSNDVGTIAMARTGVVDSATAQFFINVKENGFLNHKDKSQRGFGYAVFGRVVKGMDVVNTIKMAKTSAQGPMQNVPVAPVIIKSVRRK